MITIDEFSKIEMKVGKILSAEKVEDADKLFKLTVDLGEENTRIIISGIAPFFETPEMIIGKHVAFVSNLEPRTIRGYESNGMIMAVKTDSAFALMEVPVTITPGTRIG